MIYANKKGPGFKT